MATPKQQAGGLAALLAALALIVGTIASSTAPKPTPPPPTTTTSSTSTSSTVGAPGPGPARRWFADTASWNRTAAELGAAPELQPYVDRWWRYGGGTAPAGTVNVAFGDYSTPVYNAADATTMCRIFQTTASQRLYVMGFAGLRIGDTVPCNPTSWKPGSGNDNILLVVDERTGRVWEIGGMGQPAINCVEPFGLGPNARAGFDPTASTHLCTMGGATWSGLYTADDHSGIDGRGMGQPKAALITRAAEVQSGAIRHALEMTITSTMFGAPACNPIRGPATPGFGVSCGGYVAPATKLERTQVDVGSGCNPQVVTDAERSKTTPEGMRFALRITDAEIDRWLDSRNYTGPLRTTARIFAVALRDYGWIIAETGCWGMHIETDSVLGPAGPTWSTLGITQRGVAYPHGDLLAGLITPDRVYVVAPPPA